MTINLSVGANDDDVMNLSASGSSKKRNKFGSMFEADKMLRNSSHVTGEDCHCKLYRCFTIVFENERSTLLIRDFYNLNGRNSQYSYLAGLHSVKRRRPINYEQDASLLDHTYRSTYKVRLVCENFLEDIVVRNNGFVSNLGISHPTVQTVRVSLAKTGRAPIDQRGKHKNRGKNILSNETYDVMNYL